MQPERGKKKPRHALLHPRQGRPGHLLMDNRKEASCVTVAGDRVRPKGCAFIPQCLLRGEFAPAERSSAAATGESAAFAESGPNGSDF